LGWSASFWCYGLLVAAVGMLCTKAYVLGVWYTVFYFSDTPMHHRMRTWSFLFIKQKLGFQWIVLYYSGWELGVGQWIQKAGGHKQEGYLSRYMVYSTWRIVALGGFTSWDGWMAGRKYHSTDSTLWRIIVWMMGGTGIIEYNHVTAVGWIGLPWENLCIVSAVFKVE
jgi:hypothetical protein